MKILYIILTCEKYLSTRVVWQKQSWLNGIKDVVYLNEPVGEEIYNNAPKKYAKFLSEFKGIENYDWFFFCDDDTFVFPERLNELLVWCDRNLPLMIGHASGGFNIFNINIAWCSGGAGIVLNRTLIKNVQHYLQNHSCILTDETDITLAIWCKLSTPDFEIINRHDLFRPQAPDHGINANVFKDTVITYHYCGREDFINLNQLRNIK